MIRDLIIQQIKDIEPHDELEEDQQAAVLAWIATGADLFRLKKPDVPPRHLVSYFVLYDSATKKLLLVHHKKAQLWVPTGGHVELDENPAETVRRECEEELGVPATFFGDEKPIFVTVTSTVNEATSHTDVSLWFLLQGTADMQLKWDKREFNEVQWWHIDDILRTEVTQLDPHLHRFCMKLHALINHMKHGD